MANPVASPKPDVGIHFEVITQEGPIVIPLCFSNSLGEPHIHPGCLSHTHKPTQTHTGYNVTRSGQVYAAVLSGAGIHFDASAREKRGERKEKAGSVQMKRRKEQQSPPRSFDSLHGDDDAGNKFSRFVLFSSSALRTVIIIPNQLQHLAELCVTLQRDAQVIPCGHDDHSDRYPNLSENATLQTLKNK